MEQQVHSSSFVDSVTSDNACQRLAYRRIGERRSSECLAVTLRRGGIYPTHPAFWDRDSYLPQFEEPLPIASRRLDAIVG